jgi:4'-phosphopantetheinyl transferase EntD
MSIKLVMESLLKANLPKDISFGFCDSPDLYKPYKKESLYLDIVKSLKRADEFKAGRLSAREALNHLSPDLANSELPRLASGQVLWPSLVCGSITHSAGLAVSLVALREHYLSLGVDIEMLREVDPRISSRVASNEEIELILDLVPSQNAACLSLFSIKEALYKCIRDLTADKLEFSTAILSSVLELSPGNYQLTFRGHSLFSGMTSVLNYQPSFVLSLCWIKAKRL